MLVNDHLLSRNTNSLSACYLEPPRKWRCDSCSCSLVRSLIFTSCATTTARHEGRVSSNTRPRTLPYGPLMCSIKNTRTVTRPGPSKFASRRPRMSAIILVPPSASMLDVLHHPRPDHATKTTEHPPTTHLLLLLIPCRRPTRQWVDRDPRILTRNNNTMEHPLRHRLLLLLPMLPPRKRVCGISMRTPLKLQRLPTRVHLLPPQLPHPMVRPLLPIRIRPHMVPLPFLLLHRPHSLVRHPLLNCHRPRVDPKVPTCLCTDFRRSLQSSSCATCFNHTVDSCRSKSTWTRPPTDQRDLGLCRLATLPPHSQRCKHWMGSRFPASEFKSSSNKNANLINSTPPLLSRSRAYVPPLPFLLLPALCFLVAWLIISSNLLSSSWCEMKLMIAAIY